MVLPITRGTMNGPTRLMPLLRSVSAASTWLALEAPPEPATRPTRGCEMESGPRLASAMACCIDRKA
jgi:hypothetical protein